MRYIIINFPKEGKPIGYCACCCLPLTKGYLRELNTKLLYCSEAGEECYQFHVFMAQRAIEDQARRVN